MYHVHFTINKKDLQNLMPKKQKKLTNRTSLRGMRQMPNDEAIEEK